MKDPILGTLFVTKPGSQVHYELLHSKTRTTAKNVCSQIVLAWCLHQCIELGRDQLIEYDSCQWLSTVNNVIWLSLGELISSAGSQGVLKGLRVHSKFIVGLPAPTGWSTNGWPWGLAAPDLGRSCLTTLQPAEWPCSSLPLASTFNSLIFDRLLSRHLLSGVWPEGEME